MREIPFKSPERRLKIDSRACGNQLCTLAGNNREPWRSFARRDKI